MPVRIVLALFLATLILACSPEPPPPGSITGTELAARLADNNPPLILDVRTEKEYASGHIPGAVNIPHLQLAERMSELPADTGTEIVVHCKSGKRAESAEAVLQAAGYSAVRDLDGHMQAWSGAGLPVIVADNGE
jgi:rhodanese-related sulfurtransferase